MVSWSLEKSLILGVVDTNPWICGVVRSNLNIKYVGGQKIYTRPLEHTVSVGGIQFILFWVYTKLYNLLEHF